MTQQQLATRIGCDRSLIAQFETGRVRIADDWYEQIVDVLLAESRRRSPATLAAGARLSAVLLAGALGAADVEDERVLTHAAIAKDVTDGVARRLRSRWDSGTFSMAPETVAPMVGVCLLYPDLGVDLLVHMMEWHRAAEPSATGYLSDLHLLYVLFLANSVIASLDGGAGIIVAEVVGAAGRRVEGQGELDRLLVLEGIAEDAVTGVPPGNANGFRQWLRDVHARLSGSTGSGVFETRPLSPSLSEAAAVDPEHELGLDPRP